MKKAILGKKLGMTQIFTPEGLVVPVTVVEAGPCYVVQKKTTEKEGYNSVVVAFSKTKETLGKAVIVFTVMDEGLVVEFRDYDKPPFGENWADDWSKFDADMFSFASLFVKK